ncbi:hypothetical protein E2C01_066301 [Portunus trituberculatus]|uniref:Uncharacterized protein n=1 Tax=Portunus trituberculatus TaxID=210409 RepID=A0A5B7HQK3_PORTR|nr:hypothetical protein [Portunus trituberculatus]
MPRLQFYTPQKPDIKHPGTIWELGAENIRIPGPGAGGRSPILRSGAPRGNTRNALAGQCWQPWPRGDMC